MKIATLFAALVISFSPLASYAHKCGCGKECATAKTCTKCKKENGKCACGGHDKKEADKKKA